MNQNLIFGIRPVIEAIEADRQIDKVMIKKGADSDTMQQLRELCRTHRIQVQEVPVEKLNRLVRMPHQGVVAQTAAIEYRDVAEVLDEVTARGETPLFVLLDGVTDVRNFGAIARSAECAGAQALIVPIKNGAPVNADALKTSAGALNVIPVCRVGSPRNTLRFLQEQGLQLVGATEKSDSMLYDVDFVRPTVLVMGSEDRGVSGEILKICDARAAIPMNGTIESLNVSAAAAVLLFECVRQRSTSETKK